MPKGPREMYEKLIVAVQKREALYNSSHPAYRDMGMVRGLWDQVAEVTGLSAPEAKRLWNTLRSSYARSLNKTKLPVAKWYLADHMDFLHPFVHKWREVDSSGTKTDADEAEEDDSLPDQNSIKIEHVSASTDMDEAATSTSVGSASEADGPDHTETSPGTESHFLSQHTPPHSISDPTLQTKKRPNHNSLTTNKKPRVESATNYNDHSFASDSRRRGRVNSLTPQTNSSRARASVSTGGQHGSWLDTDADWAFFQGILPMVRLLHGRTRRRVQRDILQVIHASLDEDEDRASAALTESHSHNT